MVNANKATIVSVGPNNPRARQELPLNQSSSLRHRVEEGQNEWTCQSLGDFSTLINPCGPLRASSAPDSGIDNRR